MLSWIGELFWKFLTSGEDLKSVFLQQKITLVEHQNDVQNIGFQSTDVAASILRWEVQFFTIVPQPDQTFQEWMERRLASE